MVLPFSVEMCLPNCPLSEGPLGDDAFYLLGHYGFKPKSDPELDSEDYSDFYKIGVEVL